MAMVIIERDGKQAKVSYGSFKNSFEKVGWRISGASKSKLHKLPKENTKGEAKASSEVNGESKKASESRMNGMRLMKSLRWKSQLMKWI